MSERDISLLAGVVLAALPLGSPVLAAASELQIPAGELDRCASIDDATSRLECFDALAASIRACREAPVPETDGTEAHPRNAFRRGTSELGGGQVVPPAEDGFGLEQRRLREATAAPGAQFEIDVTIRGVLGHRDGRVVIELDNGQVWATIEPDAQRLLSVGTRVSIRRAALGSFLLVTDSRRSLRVRRLE